MTKVKINRAQFERAVRAQFPDDPMYVIEGLWQQFIRENPLPDMFEVDLGNEKTPEGTEALWGEDSL